jgi:signal transduction histidine kinase
MALVVTNILKNAVQAITLRESEKEDSTASETCKGEITVRAYCAEDESVHIEIANNGPKISPEVAEHIFMPFFSTKSGGSGIGLSLSKQIMRISGGELTLLPYSATGEWTVFSIHLL